MGSDGGVSDGGVDKETTQRQAIPAFNSSSPMLLVLTFWRDLDLEKWRAELDDQGLRIGDNQENSLKNRRKLAESTRGKLFFYFSSASCFSFAICPGFFVKQSSQYFSV